MNDIHNGSAVIDSNPEEIAKLTKKWQKMQKTGERLYKFGTSGFVITLLSPFDFEGPVAEIVAAVVAAVGFGMKTIAKNKLANADERLFSEQDESELKQTISGLADAINKNKKSK